MGYESDATLVQLCYGRELEGLFTDASLDWLIYASHEESVALGGERLHASLDRVRRPNGTLTSGENGGRQHDVRSE